LLRALGMEDFWQVGWVRGRLMPRWVVEQVAGQRERRVRALFVEAPADERELVTSRLETALGEGWQVEATSVTALDIASLPGPAFDLVWALRLPAQLRCEDRAFLLSALGRSLAPGGCMIVAPSKSPPENPGLLPCSSPGIFLRCAWAEPMLEVALDPPPPAPVRSDREIREMERDNIRRALDRAYWKISGRNGAATLLGIHPSTLRDRMRAFGIARGQ